MNKPVCVALMTALMLLPGDSTSDAASPGRVELQERVRAQINERMYDCCQAVVLTEKQAGTYEGFVQYVNGMRSDIEVTVSDWGTEYTLIRRPVSTNSPEQLQGNDLRQLRTRIEELERLARRQEAEIARLADLCRRAGMDPEVAAVTMPPDRAPKPPVVDVNNPAIVETQESWVPPVEEPIFTSSMYTQIQKGMTHRQVADALGAEGECISNSYFDGAANEVYIWANPDDSHVCVVFRDGAVLVKAQSGLPGIGSLASP